MSNYPPDETIKPQPWLAVPRTRPIRLIVIHATRGDTTQDKQYQATKNWMLSAQNNSGGWGGSTNRIISHEGQQCIAWPDEMQPTWSAGYGTASVWAIDEYAISFELAQRTRTELFTEATLARAAHEVALLCAKHGIPPVWLDRVDQTGAVPTGITGHENTDNGRKLGKTDPGVGVSFDTAAFIKRVIAELHPMGPGEEPAAPGRPYSDEEWGQAQWVALNAVQKYGLTRWDAAATVRDLHPGDLEHARRFARWLTEELAQT